jgi:NADH:ubiquinone oxidoreductase subunit C
MRLKNILLNDKSVNLFRNKVIFQKLKNSFFPDIFYLKSIRSFLWLFRGLIKGYTFKNQILEIFINSKNVYKLLYILKNSSNFNYNSLVDIFICDRPGKKKRFVITYHLLSLFKNNRIQIST